MEVKINNEEYATHQIVFNEYISRTTEDFSALFKYWEEYDELFPTTVVASNKYEIGKEKL